MAYRIDESLHTRPAYLQLYMQVREDIIRGIYPAGSKLPSKRVLADDTGVSVITVEHAYTILRDEGYIESRERSGFYVVYSEKESFSVPDSEEKPAEQRAHNLADEFPFSVIAKTMRRVMNDYGDRILIKSPNNGCPELRRAIASYLARSRGIIVKPSQIIIGSGAEYLYSMLVQFFGSDRVFAIENPCYEKIKKVYLANGIKCDSLKMGADGIKTCELERTQATVLHVTPFNSFPSGITASASKKREYIRWAVKRNGFIIEDDFDSEFTVSTKYEDTAFSLEPERTVVYLNTFSKTVAPAIRAGYMVIPEKILGEFREKVGFYSCTVPVFEQYVLAELIGGGDFERHINRIRRKRRREQKK